MPSGWCVSRYGAFMAANLLAHAGGLFACGIARRHGSHCCLCPTLLMRGWQVASKSHWLPIRLMTCPTHGPITESVNTGLQCTVD